MKQVLCLGAWLGFVIEWRHSSTVVLALDSIWDRYTRRAEVVAYRVSMIRCRRILRWLGLLLSLR